MMERTLATLMMASPIGKLALVGDQQALRSIHFESDESAELPEPGETGLLQTVRQQLTEYFEGRRQSFSIEMHPRGTGFQRQVWQQLQAIPYGQTTSYQAIADGINNSKAVRAVGAANGRNPIPIIIPCHRVIGSNGTLTGYAGGLTIKQKLLELESSNALILQSN